MERTASPGGGQAVLVDLKHEAEQCGLDLLAFFRAEQRPEPVVAERQRANVEGPGVVKAAVEYGIAGVDAACGIHKRLGRVPAETRVACDLVCGGQ